MTEHPNPTESNAPHPQPGELWRIRGAEGAYGWLVVSRDGELAQVCWVGEAGHLPRQPGLQVAPEAWAVGRDQLGALVVAPAAVASVPVNAFDAQLATLAPEAFAPLCRWLAPRLEEEAKPPSVPLLQEVPGNPAGPDAVGAAIALEREHREELAALTAHEVYEGPDAQPERAGPSPEFAAALRSAMARWASSRPELSSASPAGAVARSTPSSARWLPETEAEREERLQALERVCMRLEVDPDVALEGLDPKAARETFERWTRPLVAQSKLRARAYNKIVQLRLEPVAAAADPEAPTRQIVRWRFMELHPPVGSDALYAVLALSGAGMRDDDDIAIGLYRAQNEEPAQELAGATLRLGETVFSVDESATVRMRFGDLVEALRTEPAELLIESRDGPVRRLVLELEEEDEGSDSADGRES